MEHTIMVMQNMKMEAVSHLRSQKQRRRMVIVGYGCYIGLLIIVGVSFFGGHLLGQHSMDTARFFSHMVLISTLMLMWPLLLVISYFNYLLLSRALPEYTIKQATLDERQLRVRDSAYRRSYGVMSLAIFAFLIFKGITLAPGVHIVMPSINLFEFSFFMFGIFGLMNFVPISIIAWNECD